MPSSESITQHRTMSSSDSDENRQDAHPFHAMFRLNRTRYKTYHRNIDLEFIKQNWPEFNTTVHVDDITSRKVKKQVERFKKAGLPPLRDLCTKLREIHRSGCGKDFRFFLDSLIDKFQSDEKEEYLKIFDDATEFMEKNAPKVDGKLVTDIPKSFRDTEFNITNDSRCYSSMYSEILTGYITYVTCQTDFEAAVDICNKILSLSPPLTDDSPVPSDSETHTLDTRGHYFSELGDHEQALKDARCVGAVARLKFMNRQKLGADRDGRDMALEQCNILTLRALVRFQLQKRTHRPYFSLDEINNYEKELGIGIYSEEGYKCHNCGVSRSESRLILCTGCSRAWVCNESCHRQGWSDHKKHCKNEGWRQQTVTVQVADLKIDRGCVHSLEGVGVTPIGDGTFVIV
mmetsp:Transcript_28251/g.68745  ORF Transcript_28251/g.68745 Transcript_28251/m.68745 type:complete len:403 (-) Transcript_28251:1594-2802(-)